MSKHKKKNLQQLLQKRQQLQNVITQTGSATVVLTDKPKISPIATPADKVADTAEDRPNYHGKEIRHTLISLVIIIALIVVSLYINHKTTYFSTFGNWLYTVLRLKS